MSANTQSERFMSMVTMLAGAMVARELTNEQKVLLGKTLPRNVIKTREQAGQKLKYVEGWYVIERLNAVFGFDGWSFEPGAPVVTAFGDKSVVHVPVALRACGVVRGDLGVAVPAGKSAEALETAYKAAVTDGLKRAARTFGTGFGNRLYDKAGSGIGISTVADEMLDEVEAIETVDDVNAWAKANAPHVLKLDKDEQDIIKGACATRRREIVSGGVTPAAPPASAPDPPPGPPQALAECLERVAAIELPGAAVAVWMKHAAALAALPANDGAAAWKALVEQTKRVGKMSNPGAWIRKAIAEEDARNQRGATWTPPEEAAAKSTEPAALAVYRQRCAAAPTTDVLVAVMLELAPTVAQHREAAWGVARGRAAALGATPEFMQSAVGAARAVSTDPAAWRTAGAFLTALAGAHDRAAVDAAMKLHGAALAGLPDALRGKMRDALTSARATADLPLAKRFELALRACRTIPAVEALGDQAVQARAAGTLTAEDLRSLAKVQDEVATALERGVAA